jgi:hypothetical protein
MALLLLQDRDFPKAKTPELHKALRLCGRKPRKTSEVPINNIGNRKRRQRSSSSLPDCQSDMK